jgi:hypothetical protein
MTCHHVFGKISVFGTKKNFGKVYSNADNVNDIA